MHGVPWLFSDSQSVTIKTYLERIPMSRRKKSPPDVVGHSVEQNTKCDNNHTIGNSAASQHFSPLHESNLGMIDPERTQEHRGDYANNLSLSGQKDSIACKCLNSDFSSKSEVSTGTPLTNRGVGKIDNGGRLIELIGCNYDYLTITTARQMSDYLSGVTKLKESFGKQQGFSNVEKRFCLGGDCSRRFNPVSPSNDWGLDYESWLFTGLVADDNVRLLLKCDAPSRLTRLDIAFDYSCPADYYPKDFIEDVRANIYGKYGIETAGNEITGTRYIGSRQSDRYIRIYRKDLEDKQVEMQLGPVMRIELVIQNTSSYCQCAWNSIRSNGYYSGIQYASMMCHALFQLMPIPFDETIFPEPIEKPESGIIKKVFSLVDQRGNCILAALKAGIDLQGLCELKRFKASSSALSRFKELETDIRAVGADVITEAAANLLNFKNIKKSP